MFRIDALRADDWDAVRAIYLEGIATGVATFETGAPSWEKWDAGHLASPRLAAREIITDRAVNRAADRADGAGRVMGWAALSTVSDRCVYAGVAEVSIYVAAAARGQGAGRALLGALCDETDRAGLWTLQAGIFPENLASMKLHAACGFRVVGRREKLGKLGGAWRDVILLERRSRVAGID
jgi:phosphinothricin acetyltransferase